MNNLTIAVIGGSGLYNLPGLTEVEEHNVTTPFGDPSSPIIGGNLEGTRMLFVARHGIGHRHTPSEVNYKANIFALKALGASRVISVSAVGSMREDIHPGDVVVPNQYIDRTKGRDSTFFGDGIVGHVMFADPVCADLSAAIVAAAKERDVKCHDGGTLMVMEGPAFSTRAESLMHRQLDVDLIGMTAMPEAKLARESELCYATMALATDFDCWHEEEEDVSVESVMEIMKNNVQNAREILRRIAVNSSGGELPCACGKSLEYAIVTDRKVIPAATRERMAPVFGRVL